MLFNSLPFLTAFALVAIVYYALPHGARWMLLLAASAGFYATFDAAYLVPLTIVTSAAYCGGLAIERLAAPRARRVAASLFVAVILVTLIAYKHLNVVGVSFYALSAISYLVDVQRRQIAVERHAGYLTVYLSFFPKLLAGPIERAGEFLIQMRRPVAFDEAAIVSGLQQMLWGLFKKVVIADRLAVLVDRAYAQPSLASPADLVLGTYFFAIQLYCDFSGYSDIAIGASRVLGFELGENFRRPYLATSVGEFWSERWHRSLASWFRDYVYIPLGGSRVPLPRHTANVMAVFLLSGLWHGLNWTFVVWGGLNGVYQTAAVVLRRARPGGGLSRVTGRFGPSLSRLLTFHLILISWVFFRAASIGDAVTVLQRSAASAASLAGLVAARLMAPEVMISVLLICLLFVVEVCDERQPVWTRLRTAPVAVRWGTYYGLAAGLLVLGVWDLQQFVYMQF